MASVRSPFSRGSTRTLAVVLATATVAAVLLATPRAQNAHAAPGTPAANGAGGGPGDRPAVPPASQGPALDRWVKGVIQRMPLEHKVGQLFTTFVYGSDAGTPDPRNTDRYGVDTPAEVVRKYHLGGVVYFSWTDNVKDGPRQIAGLSNGLQRAAVSSGSGVPLMISIDQEYGQVTRVGPPVTQFPGNMALGAARSTEPARQAAAIGGAELRAMGINQDFAPVADVNVNPANPVIGVRSYSSDPQLTGELTAAQVAGYQQGGGIAAAAKHFPGHGDTETDSHTGIPYITHTKKEWDRIDAPPFRSAIEAGVDVIMTGHLVMPSLDPTETPGTLSRPIVTGLLREELGYDGVVITDALDMAGVRLKYSDERIPVRALNAGVDMLLMPQDLDTAYRAVLDAVRSGEIPMERIEQALARVLKLKATNWVMADPFVDEERVDQRVGTDEHVRQAQALTDRTTTLIKNDAGTLPFTSAPGSMLVAGTTGADTGALASAVRARGTETTAVVTGTTPSDASIANAVAEAREHRVTVVLTQQAANPRTDPDERQTKLVAELLATGRPVIVVAVRDAYDIANFPDAPTFLATYSMTAVAMTSLARVMYGETAPSGRLPVAIPAAGAPGTDLYPFGHGLTWR